MTTATKQATDTLTPHQKLLAAQRKRAARVLLKRRRRKSHQ